MLWFLMCAEHSIILMTVVQHCSKTIAHSCAKPRLEESVKESVNFQSLFII